MKLNPKQLAVSAALLGLLAAGAALPAAAASPISAPAAITFPWSPVAFAGGPAAESRQPKRRELRFR